MKKKIAIVIIAIIVVASILVLVALVISGIYFVERQKERDRIVEEVSARMHYAELFALIDESGGNRDTFRVFRDDPYCYKQVTFEMEHTRQPEEYEVILYPGHGTAGRIEEINNYLRRKGLEIEGFNGTTMLVTVEDVIYQYDKVQKIIETMF